MTRSFGAPRAFVGAVVVLVSLLAGAQPAAAHGRGADATNFSSTVVQSTPIDGVSWGVHGGDELLSVTNESGRDLVVLGYDNEPYLRVGPDGVFENRRSPATYRNRSRADVANLPEIADPEAEPDWQRVGDGPTWSWFDHRIHWDGEQLPDAVRDNPNRQAVVREWTVLFMFGGATLPVYGELTWEPGPNPWWWLLGGVAVASVALVGMRPGRGRSDGRALARPAAALLGGVAVLNVAHLVDGVAAVPPGVAIVWSDVALTAALVLVIAGAAWRGRSGDAEGFLALELGALVAFFGQGIAYRSVLGASHVTSVWPAWVVRAAVALSLAQALTVFVAAEIGKRRTPDTPATH